MLHARAAYWRRLPIALRPAPVKRATCELSLLTHIQDFGNVDTMNSVEERGRESACQRSATQCEVSHCRRAQPVPRRDGRHDDACPEFPLERHRNVLCALHALFQEIYEDHFQAQDDLAERIKAMDMHAGGQLAALPERSKIRDVDGRQGHRDAGLLLEAEETLAATLAAPGPWHRRCPDRRPRDPPAGKPTRSLRGPGLTCGTRGALCQAIKGGLICFKATSCKWTLREVHYRFGWLLLA